MCETMIKIESVSKQYKLGQINGTTLRDELQRKRAKLKGLEDPTLKIGAKTYTSGETFLALDNVSFTVKKGERVGIIGHNGAGKSTLLKLVSRVTAPSAGAIYLNGRVASMLEVGTGFHGELTGRENIYLNGAILGMTKNEISGKIQEIIEFSECRQFIDTPVKRYSSGMYVKLAFAVASHLDSEILIMDEVLAVGDIAFQKKCLEKMSNVANIDGRTILYVSHNMSTIRRLCDRVIVLDHGKMAFDGGVEEGIDIYSQRNGSPMVTRYDLRETKRPYKSFGTDIKIVEFQFYEKQFAVYNSDEIIHFSLTVQSHKAIEGLKLYLSIQTADDITVGMTQTYEKLCDTKENELYVFRFQWDASNLAPGKYKFQPDVFSDDGFGNHKSLDHPLQDVFFEIVDNRKAGLCWQSYFGKVSLNELVLSE